MRLEAAGRFARGDGINEIAGPAGHAGVGAAVAAGLAERRGRGAPVEGPVSREKLGPQQWARLEAELRRGPLAHGFAGDQRWTLGRIKTLIGKLGPRCEDAGFPLTPSRSRARAG